MTGDEQEPQPLPPWFDDPDIPDLLRLIEVASAVAESHGDPADVVAALVAEWGETEAMRVLALAALRTARTAASKVRTEVALAAASDATILRCPECGYLCANCVDEWEQDLRDSMGLGPS